MILSPLIQMRKKNVTIFNFETVCKLYCCKTYTWENLLPLLNLSMCVYGNLYGYKNFWVYILSFYLVVSIHACMHIYTAAHFNNFIIFLIVKDLFLFQTNYLGLLKKDLKEIMTFFVFYPQSTSKSFRILTQSNKHMLRK